MIKLYVVTHKDIYIPASPSLVCIKADVNTGDNIANKEDYSELRAHYWVWKNETKDTDYVGLFQFRRYLNPDRKRMQLPNVESRQKPYYIKKFPKSKDYTPNIMEAIIRNTDVLAPIREYTGQSVYERYKRAHREKDLRLVHQIIASHYPEYLNAANDYFNGAKEYFGNIYIMRRNVYDSYCQWLFDILSTYDASAEDIPHRTQGYLAERLFGVWYTKVSTEGIHRCFELPRIHFWGYDDATHHLLRDKLINIVLPPGSKRRAKLQKVLKG